MSRIGKKPVIIPEKVKVEVKEGVVYVQGPNGKLQRNIHPAIGVTVVKNEVLVKLKTDERSFHGLTRTLIQNMVTGVSKGFEKKLEINGLGLKAKANGQTVNFSLGFAHPVMLKLPDVVKIKIEGGTKLTLTSPNKEVLGSVAADIRSLKPPEPYKGTGIKYHDEVIVRKVGKTTGAGAA